METRPRIASVIREVLSGDHTGMEKLICEDLYTEEVLMAICDIPNTAHNTEYFQLLIGLSHTNVNINMKLGVLGMPAVSHAICNGHYVTVRIIIGTLKADIEGRDLNGFTPLHHATFQGDLDIVKLLLERGADMHAMTNENNSPSELASIQGHTAVVQKLAKTETRLRKLAFAMMSQKRLGEDASGSILHSDIIRKIALVAASDVGI
jgi:hypothetical protein